MKTKILVAITVLLLTFCIVRSTTTVVVVSGNSMSPTLTDGSQLTLNKLKHPHVNDIIVFLDPVSHTYSVKRPIAIEGETVDFNRNGKVYVNGERLNEYYLPKHTVTISYTTNHFVVEPNHVFVLGDNRYNSADSREYGTVPRKNIVGVIAP
jgi:signal peptidase I